MTLCLDCFGRLGRLGRLSRLGCLFVCCFDWFDWFVEDVYVDGDDDSHHFVEVVLVVVDAVCWPYRFLQLQHPSSTSLSKSSAGMVTFDRYPSDNS